MKYDDYRYYCEAVEELRSKAMEALFNAMHEETREDQEEADKHRTIRMLIEQAITGIGKVLACEEVSNPDISPDEYEFADIERKEAAFSDNFFAWVHEEGRAI